jgi:orotidine-5'-phosphate decarboxylase
MAELIVALDLPERAEALALVDRLGPDARFYKVGLELFTRVGPEVLRELRMRERAVFLDLKLHDIPNTVAAAAGAAAEHGVELLTVHASGGTRMISAAREAVEGSGTRLLAVTVLTSMSEAGLSLARGVPSSPRDEVLRLADLAMEHGAHGVVASPLEVALLRARLGPDALLVTPGIRLGGEDAHDQARVSTPQEAVRAGADFLVVGRTISRATDPVEALAGVRAGMEMEVEEV